MEQNQNYPTGVIVYSDRESKYTANEYEKYLAKYWLLGSMNRKVDFWESVINFVLKSDFS